MGKNFCKIGAKWCKFCRRDVCEFSHTPTESLPNRNCPIRRHPEVCQLRDGLQSSMFLLSGPRAL